MSMPCASLLRRQRENRRMALDTGVYASITRPGPLIDGPWGRVPGPPVVVAELVPVSVTPLSLQAAERYFGTQEVGTTGWVIELPWGTDVQQADTITLTDRRSFAVDAIRPLLTSVVVTVEQQGRPI